MSNQSLTMRRHPEGSPAAAGESEGPCASFWKLSHSLLWFLLLLLTVAATAQSPVTIEIHPENPGKAIPADFIGLSFETAAVLPGIAHSYLFRADNSSLVRLVRTLGIRSLRIGGNTADRPTVKVPENPDLDNLFAFARAAQLRVIYTLRLRESKPQDVVNLAQYLIAHYKNDLDCLAIGNEPNIYFKEYSAYRDQLKQFMAAINGLPHGSKIKFCGPSTTPGKPEWSRGFAEDFGHTGQVRWITQHSYPGGDGKKVQDVAAGRDTMLATGFQKTYEHLYELFVPQVMSDGLTYRIEETNNFFHGGAKDVSDTFASALWGLDYLYWWALHNAEGINFHTGDNVAAGEQQTPCRYAVFWTSEAGYSVHPLGYAIKAFDLGNHGRMLPVNFISNKDAVNLTAYSVLGADKTLYLTLINKEHGSSGRAANATINLKSPYASAQQMLLSAPQNDVAAQSGITLGGAAITDDGKWNGTWTQLPASRNKKMFSVTIAPATAVVIKLAPR